MEFNNRQSVPIFIRPNDLHLYNSVKFVDVRSPEAYAKGHLENAVNLYDLFTYLLPTSRKDSLDEMQKHFQQKFRELGISGKEHIVIYEQSMDKQYGASCRGFFIFKYMKHPCVSTLEGGLDAWIQLQDGTEKLTKNPPTITPCDYCGQDDEHVDDLMADREDILHVINNKISKTWLLDVRDADEWNGISSSPYGVDFTPRKGRIPKSVWIEWYDFHHIDKENHQIQYKSNEQIQELMMTNGIQKDDEIIIYCFKGSRASVALMKLKEAGYNNVKNYFASWNEWSRDLQLPVDDRILIEAK